MSGGEIMSLLELNIKTMGKLVIIGLNSKLNQGFEV